MAGYMPGVPSAPSRRAPRRARSHRHLRPVTVDVYEVRDHSGRLRFATLYEAEAVRYAQGLYRYERGKAPEVTVHERAPVDHRRAA